MKKFLTAILISLILIAGNTVFVQAAGPANARSSHAQAAGSSNTHSKRAHSAKNYQARLGEITPLLQTVRANNEKALRLRAEARTAYNKAKNHIAELIKNKDRLTIEQLQDLKDMLSYFTQDKQTLESSQGNIAKNIPGLRNARKTKNIDEAKTNLTNLNNVLTERIKALQKVVDDFNKLASI